jgi:phage terminase large subunit GpA-like protein
LQGGEACQFFPSKGRGGIQVRLTVQESLAESLGDAIKVYHYSDDDIKKQLYIARIKRRIKPVEGVTPGPAIHFPLQVDPEFKAELCSERLTIEKEGGLTREKWEKDRSTPNDWGDALKLQLVLWHVLGPFFKDWKPECESSFDV